MKRKIISYMQLSIGMMLAGSSVVWGKILIGHMSVFASQFISLLIALIAIIPFVLLIEGNPFKNRISKKDMFYLFLQSLTGMFLFRVFLLEGLKRTGAIEAGIITSLTPPVLYILSIILLRDKVKPKGLAGIFLCIVGIIFINVKTGSMQGNTIFGNVLVFLAITGEALFSIFRKKLSFKNKPITSTAIIILISTVLFAPIGISDVLKISFSTFNFEIVFSLIFYGVFCTVIAYICWFSGISEIKASVAAGFTVFLPITSIALSVIVLNETLLPKHLIGAIIAVAGIMLITGDISFKKKGK